MMHCFTMSALRIPGIATFALILTLFLPVLASAADVTLQPNQGPVGTGVKATGTGWLPNTDIQISFEFQNVGTVRTDASGGFTATFCVPNRQPGVYPVYFIDGRNTWGPPFTITAGTAVNCQASGTSVILERALTYNGEGDFVEQSQFAPGEAIRYGVVVNNTGSSAVTPRFAFQASGPREIFSGLADASIPPGRWLFFTTDRIPTDAPSGTYTFRATMAFSGQTAAKESSFTVTALQTALPRLTLSLNQTTFCPGDTLRVGLQAGNPGPGFNADFYFGYLQPDGVTAVFLTSLAPLNSVTVRVDGNPQTFKPLAANVPIPQGLNVTLNEVFATAFSGSDLPGTYVFFAFFTPPGAFNDGRVDTGDILASDSKAFTVSSSFTVDSTSGWQNTCLKVTAGQELSFSAAGSWTVDFRNFPYVGPDGYSPQVDSTIYQGCKLDSVHPYGVLLVRIGADDPSFIAIGSKGGFPAYRDGFLAFRIHDGDACLADNAGTVTVSVNTSVSTSNRCPGAAFAFPVNSVDISGQNSFIGWLYKESTWDSVNNTWIDRSEYHAGLDFYATQGTPVMAVADGGSVSRKSWSTVEQSWGIDIYYPSVVNKDGSKGIEVYTNNLIDGKTKVLDIGSSVNVGDVIGYVGGLGARRYNTPHIHWSVGPKGYDDQALISSPTSPAIQLDPTFYLTPNGNLNYATGAHENDRAPLSWWCTNR